MESPVSYLKYYDFDVTKTQEISKSFMEALILNH